MKTSRSIVLGTVAALAVVAAWIGTAYRRDLAAARQRVAASSTMVETKCGPIEYAVRGEGPPVLVVHGAGGGFDQGLMLGEAIRGFRIIAPSRFGYLRTPLPRDASPEAQADAHACLLDALQLDRVAIVGVSAGGPSTMQFCLRHPRRCGAMVLLVPLAFSDRPAAQARLSRTQEFVIEHTLSSDFGFWAATRLFRGAMVESILGTPMRDVRDAPAADRERIFATLDLIQPISQRKEGLRNEGLVAQSLRRYDLEKIAAPTLIASVEDDGYLTYVPARYTAAHIPGAKFVGFPRGGHMWVGHQAEVAAEVQGFLERAASAPAVQ
jgi:pimeloyl-ACP methyl ester carboxylesterase